LEEFGDLNTPSNYKHWYSLFRHELGRLPASVRCETFDGLTGA